MEHADDLDAAVERTVEDQVAADSKAAEVRREIGA